VLHHRRPTGGPEQELTGLSRPDGVQPPGPALRRRDDPCRPSAVGDLFSNKADLFISIDEVLDVWEAPATSRAA
jgi:hypothetical protein